MGFNPRLYWRQFKALTYKNFLLIIRSWKLSLTRLLVPGLFILLSWITLQAAKGASNVVHPPSIPLDTNIPVCTLDDNCKTLIFSPANDSFVYSIMKTLADTNTPPLKITPYGAQPSADDDVVPLYEDIDWSSYYSRTSYLTGLANNTNPYRVQGGIFFLSDNTPSNINYVILYNDSTICPFFSSSCSEPSNYRDIMQIRLEQSIASFLLSREIHFELETKMFPTVNNPMAEVIVEQLQQIFIYCAATFGFVFVMNQICSEKDLGIRGYMKTIGLRDHVFWFSWFIDQYLVYVVAMAIVLIFGYALPEITFFSHTSFSVFLVVFIIYGLAIIMFAFALSTLLPNAKGANIAGFACFAIGIGWAATFGSLGNLTYYLWQPSVISVAGNWPKIFWFFPPLHLCKIVLDIQCRSNMQYSVSQQTPNTTVGYFSWDDMYDRPPFYAGDNSHIPTTHASLMNLIANAAMYCVLTWYLDKVIPNKNKKRLQPWFFLTKSYWGIKTRHVDHNIHVNHDVTDIDLKAEIDSAMNEGEQCMRIVGLDKTYRRYPWVSGGDVRALKNFFFSAQRGSIVAILGHNGAGKTSLINILTGLIASDVGNVFMYGKQLGTDNDEISEMIGICPQFDILWGDLSSREHLKILSKLKLDHVSDSDIAARLADVKLTKVADNPSSTYSGGMKRRLSVAISTIGNPKIIFMDEPTTGMDPRNRRFVWSLVQKIKQDRLIILTTHAMEEADVLGEKIAIMADGQLKCVGDPLHLKTRFGSGYRINIVTDVDKTEQVNQLITKMVPGAEKKNDNAGNLVYAIHDIEEESVAPLFEFLEEQAKGEKPLIRDWGIMNSTLEDVFLKVLELSHK